MHPKVQVQSRKFKNLRLCINPRAYFELALLIGFAGITEGHEIIIQSVSLWSGRKKS
jgi:hypothetical protein